VYIALRRKAKLEGIEYADELNDKFIDLDLLQQQMHEQGEQTVFSIRIPDSAEEHYDDKQKAEEVSV
jgi:hypothetical protein